MTKTAVVTGASRGLGLDLARGLCRALDGDAVVYLASRDACRGARAVELLRGEGYAPRLAQLDVRDVRTVRALAERVGGVDVVVSNAAAGVAPGVRVQDQVRALVDTNNHGTHRLITEFGPLLNDGARFVVVASALGALRHLPQSLRDRFDPAELTLDELARVMDDYVAAVETGRAAEAGWPGWIDVASKVGQVAALKVMARDLAGEARRRDLAINAACPGDPGDPRAAGDLLWLATLPAGSSAPYGELVRHRKVLPFHA